MKQWLPAILLLFLSGSDLPCARQLDPIGMAPIDAQSSEKVTANVFGAFHICDLPGTAAVWRLGDPGRS
jgi:hypothetical protein